MREALKSREVVCSAAIYDEVHSFSQGTPAPAFLPRHRYGASGTIHQTGTIDVSVDPETKAVVAVWFRCLSLPFTVWEREYANGSIPNPVNQIAIEEIVFVDLPSEESSQ